MTVYESFEIAAKEIEAKYGKEKPMKQYLISEDRVKSLLKTNQWSDDKDALMNLPEAQFLDLSKVDRHIPRYLGDEDGIDLVPTPDGWIVRYSDLTAIVQPKPIREIDGSLTYPHERPDVSALVEALEKAIADLQWMSGSEDFGVDGKAEKGWRKIRMNIEGYVAALSAYRGGK